MTDTSLFGFIFNTLLRRINNPANARFWLPSKLLGLDASGGGGKLLPLHETNWNFGQITGSEGADINGVTLKQWWLLKTVKDRSFDDDMPIPCPEQPWPRLSMPEITIAGLENAYVLGQPVITQPSTGYTAVISIQFGHYDSKTYPQVSQLLITGTWDMKLCGCSAPKNAPTVCDGKLHDDIDGSGPITVAFSNVVIDATIDISVAGAGAGRSLSVVVRKLHARGATPDSLPDIQITRLDFQTTYGVVVKTLWKNSAKNLISSSDGRATLMTNLNNAINSPDNLRQITQMCTQNVGSTLDSILGPAPAGQLPNGQAVPNPANAYLFDRIRLALNTPASPFYAPKIVATSSNPPLEPYTAERIELGPQSIDSIDFDAANLLNANIRGFSNASVPEAKLRITGARVDAEVDIGALAHPPVVSDNTGRKIQVPPPPLAIQADFELDLSGSPLPGKANVTIANASVLATANFSGADDTTLEIGFSALSLRADLGGMKIALQIDSDFQEDVNQIVNQNSIKQRVVDGINAKAAPQLGQIGQTATKEARAAIVAQLGS